MSSIGWAEIAIVVVLALLIFGPKKLPDIGASLGRSISGFKKGLRETREEFQEAVKEEPAAIAVPSSAPSNTTVSAASETAGVETRNPVSTTDDAPEAKQD